MVILPLRNRTAGHRMRFHTLRYYPLGLALSAALLLSLLGKTEDKRPRVEPKITILSTMLTEFRGIGEWGFAAVVEFEGRKLLFDTGGRPDTVIKNAKELGVDLGDVETVTQLLAAAGTPLESAALLSAMDQLDEATAAAQELGIPDAPAYQFDDQVFVGREHLPVIENLLRGRAP